MSMQTLVFTRGVGCFIGNYINTRHRSPIIGEIGLFLEEAASIELGAFVNFEDPEADQDGDGKISPSLLGSAFQAEIYANAEADLPLYFPIRSLPLGGFTEDRNGDGFSDNALSVNAGFSIDESLTLETTFDYALPNISLDFGAVQAFIAYIDNPVNMLNGMEGFFDGIDYAADGIDSVELPLIGGEAFDGLLTVCVTYAKASGAKNGSGKYSEKLGFLQEKIDAGETSVFDAILDELRQSLFDGFNQINLDQGLDPDGPNDDGEGASTVDDALFAFVVPVVDEDGVYQYDDFGKLQTRLPTSKDDIELIFSPEGLLTFNLKFGGVLVDGELPIDFGVGIPGLSLDVDAALQARIDYLMGIGLGIDPGGLFLDTSGINLAGEEVALNMAVSLTTDSNGGDFAYTDPLDLSSHTPVSAPWLRRWMFMVRQVLRAPGSGHSRSRS